MISSDEMIHLVQVGAVLAVGWHAALFVGSVVRAVILMLLPDRSTEVV